MTDDLRYPIGRFTRNGSLSDADRQSRIDDLAALPSRLTLAVDGLTDVQLDTPYRDEGWTVRQVVHHLADSHANAYMRMKLALTEPSPVIRAYDERAWAGLADSQAAPVILSLDLIDALHCRWTWWLRTLAPADFTRPLVHPESGETTVEGLLELYAWHGRHHLAHITNVTARNGW
ncbi:MAG TPA: bacillithiol transferase BstA [Vicinamibacterales bacterium]|nr:bacillithiol transferase BstA [Vicinamibacterales bacterium]